MATRFAYSATSGSSASKPICAKPEKLPDVAFLAAFVPRPVSGMVEEKAAIEFETQLHAVLQKHGIER
jgi:hypothetical protein